MQIPCIDCSRCFGAPSAFLLCHKQHFDWSILPPLSFLYLIVSNMLLWFRLSQSFFWTKLEALPWKETKVKIQNWCFFCLFFVFFKGPMYQYWKVAVAVVTVSSFCLVTYLLLLTADTTCCMMHWVFCFTLSVDWWPLYFRTQHAVEKTYLPWWLYGTDSAVLWPL